MGHARDIAFSPHFWCHLVFSLSLALSIVIPLERFHFHPNNTFGKIAMLSLPSSLESSLSSTTVMIFIAGFLPLPSPPFPSRAHIDGNSDNFLDGLALPLQDGDLVNLQEIQ